MRSQLQTANTDATSSPLQDKSQVFKKIVVLVVAGVLLTFGLLGFWRQYEKTNNQSPLPSSEVVTASEYEPDETKIDTSSVYTVPNEHPRRISIPSLEVDGFIQKVGIDQNGAVAVPTNVHLAGWFVDKSTPGEPGLSIIDGHLRGRYQSGIFERIDELVLGDTFTIEMGDLTNRQYKVVSVDTYSVEDATKHLFTKREEIFSQLNLVTCGGRFDSSSGQYDERVIVVSKLTAE